jgi:hypothetical protein
MRHYDLEPQEVPCRECGKLLKRSEGHLQWADRQCSECWNKWHDENCDDPDCRS